MSLNGVTYAVRSNDNPYSEKPVKNSTITEQKKNGSIADDTAVVYEREHAKTSQAAKIYTRDNKTIAALKSEVARRTEQFRQLVEQLILKQGKKFTHAEEAYKLLREGKLNADPATIAKAREEISESGYWGVEQTSERLFSFAFSLAGGDPAKAQELRDAFIKGYKEAERAWGGQLPEICRKTYEATLKKFDEWMSE